MVYKNVDGEVIPPVRSAKYICELKPSLLRIIVLLTSEEDS